MNGYKKMKRLAGMKVLKALSAVTALSMTVTSLAVSASANSVTPDVISNALGDLKNFGIVSDSFTSANHFESNFAAKDVTLNNNFDVDNYVIRGARKITFKVTTDETFKEGETKTYTFGVFCNDKLIDVVYNGETRKGILAVDFDQAGDKTFTITIPEEYRYETVRIYKMDIVADEDGVRYTTSEAGVDFIPDAGSKEEMIQSNSQCIVGGSLLVNSVMIGENKIMNVTPEIYDKITQENDGRYSYRQGDYSIIIANRSNVFNSRPEAGEDVDRLIAQITEASETLSKVQSGSNRVIFGVMESDIDYGTENQANIKVIPAVGEPEMKTIGELYNQVKSDPDLTLLINVNLNDNYYFNMKFHSNIDNWDVDTASRIVFNFIGGTKGITSIYLGDGFRGTVIAPNARVMNESTIAGAVYAPVVSNPGGEIHRASYRSFVDFYQAYFYDEEEVTTPASEETEPEETTPEVTEPEETTSEETEPEETTTTTVDEETHEATTVTEPEETTEATTTEETTTTTTPEVTTTTTAPVVTTTTTTTPPPVVTTTTTTPPPVVTTTTTTTPPPVVTTTTTTTPPPVVTTTTTTTPPPVVTTTTTTTPPPVVTTTTTTTPAPVEEVTTTTTPAPVEEVTTTTTPAPVEEVTTTTTPAPVEEVTTPPEEEEVTTVTEPEIVETTPEEVTEATTPESEETIPEEETTPAPEVPEEETTTTTTTTILIELEEEPPRDELILIDEDVPLGDTPFNTGVDNHIGLFITIGSLALLIGVGAQVYTVILKKNN